MISDVRLDETVSIMAANPRVGQVHVFDHGLPCSAVVLGYLAAKDPGDFMGLADGPMGVQEPFSPLVQGSAAAEAFAICWCGAKRTNSYWRFTPSRRLSPGKKPTAWHCRCG